MPESSSRSPARTLPPRPACGYYLNSIYFYLTQGCNLRCRHCWIKPPFESAKDLKYPYVKLDTFKHIVEQGIELGLGSVKLTGGEPLIHPEIESIIEYIHDRNLGLNIETNGTVLTPALARLILASEKRVNLSISIDSHIDTVHEKIRGVKGSFQAALNGVKYMCAAGYRPQVIMSVTRGNMDHIEPLVRLAEEIGAGSVKFNPVTPTARGKALHESGEALTIEEILDIGRFVDDELQPRSKVPLIYANTPAFRSIRNIEARPNIKSCGILGIIGVLGTGQYALCGIGESLPEFIFGDVLTDDLKTVWNQAPLLNEIRQGLPSKLTGVCRDCVLKPGCLGSCLADNYNYYKRLFAPHRYCQIAYEAGLFPRSRLVPESPHDLNYQPSEAACTSI